MKIVEREYESHELFVLVLEDEHYVPLPPSFATVARCVGRAPPYKKDATQDAEAKRGLR